MQRFFILLLFSFLLMVKMNAQNPWASSVLDYHFGTGQTLGQDAPNFPGNVLGSVSPSVSATVPASLPSEVLSLGRNGWIILGFDQEILNGNGADFTVFENAFEYSGGLVFDEWLMVSVSQDGQNWVTFPYDSLTGAGMAGRTPTNGGGINYQDVTQSGGNSFDLADLGLASIRYVKLQDATRFQSSEKISAEVDAVIAIHTGLSSAITANETIFSIKTQPGFLELLSAELLNCTLIDVSGKISVEITLLPGQPYSFPTHSFPEGVCFLSLYNSKRQFSRCIYLWHK